MLLAGRFRSPEEGRDITIENIPFTTAIGITSLLDSGGSKIQIQQKDPSKPRTQLEEDISRALKKADRMSEAAKKSENGIISDWDDAYLESTVLNPKIKELRDAIDGIIRHWISDDDALASTSKIRELLLPYLTVEDSIEELNRILLHINTELLKDT